MQLDFFKDDAQDARERAERGAKKSGIAPPKQEALTALDTSLVALKQANRQDTQEAQLVVEDTGTTQPEPAHVEAEDHTVLSIGKKAVADKIAIAFEHEAERARNALTGPYTHESVEVYDEAVVRLEALYSLFAGVNRESREELEDLRLRARKEIIVVEKKLDVLCERLEVTQGRPEKLLEEVHELGLRHIRLYDQYEILARVLGSYRDSPIQGPSSSVK